jgi:hypothetical protein
MVTGIDDDRRVWPFDQPKEVSDGLISFRIAAHTWHDSGTPPILADADHERVNRVV